MFFNVWKIKTKQKKSARLWYLNLRSPDSLIIRAIAWMTLPILERPWVTRTFFIRNGMAVDTTFASECWPVICYPGNISVRWVSIKFGFCHCLETRCLLVMWTLAICCIQRVRAEACSDNYSFSTNSVAWALTLLLLHINRRRRTQRTLIRPMCQTFLNNSWVVCWLTNRPGNISSSL